MNIGDKQQFINDILANAKDYLTVANAEKLEQTLDDVLQNYSVAREVRSDPTEFIDAFLTAKETEGRSAGTIHLYRYRLEKFFEQTKTSPTSTTIYTIRKYLLDMQHNGAADKTRSNVVSVLSSFFAWLFAEGLIDKNPCANLGAVKCRKEIRNPFTPEDIEKLRIGCESSRDRAIMEFLLSTGCRISEAIALDVSDVDLSSDRCKVLGKGNKERTVYINATAKLWLKKYLSERKCITGALFAGRATDRMTTNGVREMFKRLEEATGVHDVHPHRFRRTLATSLITKGMGIEEVAFILGHDNINTTMTYVKLDEANTCANYNKYSA